MTESQSYPEPGVELDEAAALVAITEFRKRFTSQGGLPTWKGEKQPAWCDLKPSFHVERLTGFAVETLLAQSDDLRFYVEFASRVRLAGARSIVDWFELRPPWVDPDVYVFPKTLAWCLVSTHESDVLLVSPSSTEAEVVPLTPPN